MISNSILMELIANGIPWYYESYDYHAASEEMIKINVHNYCHYKPNNFPYYLIM